MSEYCRKFLDFLRKSLTVSKVRPVGQTGTTSLHRQAGLIGMPHINQRRPGDAFTGEMGSSDWGAWRSLAADGRLFFEPVFGREVGVLA